MYTPEKIEEVQDELRGKGVKYCIGAYVDIHGIPKGKVVPLDAAVSVVAGEIMAPLQLLRCTSLA